MTSTEPCSGDEIRRVGEKALEKKKLASENRALRQELEERASPQAAVGLTPELFGGAHHVGKRVVGIVVLADVEGGW